VSEVLREQLFEKYNSTILCSATLAVQGKFDHVHRTLGVDEPSQLGVPSSFDYEKQAVLYLPPGMPDPREDTFLEKSKEATVDLLHRTKGRAFCLFTSYDAMTRMHAAIKDVIPFPALLHGTMTRKALLEEFRKTPNAVLFLEPHHSGRTSMFRANS
jgi:ATP-dependent DNA helicase DinG